VLLVVPLMHQQQQIVPLRHVQKLKPHWPRRVPQVKLPLLLLERATTDVLET
jgi:hypothetical protein